MNCKPGDLAITVPHNNSETGRRNSGRLVKVLRWVGPHYFAGSARLAPHVWLCESLGGKLIDAYGRAWGPEVLIDDGNLRPIRSTDGMDETLRLHELDEQR